MHLIVLIEDFHHLRASKNVISQRVAFREHKDAQMVNLVAFALDMKLEKWDFFASKLPNHTLQCILCI